MMIKRNNKYRHIWRWVEMKFIKGMVIGGLITTGIVMMYAEGTGMMNKKKMLKKGRQMAKKVGIL